MGTAARSATDTRIARARERKMARGFATPLRREEERAPLPRPIGEDAATANSVVLRGCGVWIFAEGMSIAFSEDLHHPAIKVIDRVVHDGFEATVVFSMSFLNVITQS